jgi:hypothetical protein
MVVAAHVRHHHLMFQILQRAAMVLGALEVSMSLRCLLVSGVGTRARRAA